ncbi:MAG: TonB-dependent receptor plug domain-containing protein, partial [Gemmatimonadetes bacterium]|nr:TonB-dependent receptor plug domain-containing protein [Gemmatimonadota bacterium]
GEEETQTNSQGRFTFTDVSAGALLLTVRRVGYQPRSDTLVAFPGITVDVDLTISAAAIELDPIQVVARAPYLEARGFYRRQRTTNGWQANRQKIDETAPTGDLTRLFRTIPGVSVERDRFGAVVLQSRRGRCAIGTFLDGMRTPGLDVSTFPPEAVEAMEVYVGISTPMEYDNNCGALLIWSRRPGSEEFRNRAANRN